MGSLYSCWRSGTVDDDDLRNLSPNELQARYYNMLFLFAVPIAYIQRAYFPFEDSYDVELAPLESIESWITSSTILRNSIESNPNLRRSTRTRKQPKWFSAYKWTSMCYRYHCGVIYCFYMKFDDVLPFAMDTLLCMYFWLGFCIVCIKVALTFLNKKKNITSSF
jgi:hypothetical protein